MSLKTHKILLNKILKMFKILAQLFGLTLSIKLKEKQKFVSSWDLAASNSPSNSPNK